MYLTCGKAESVSSVGNSKLEFGDLRNGWSYAKYEFTVNDGVDTTTAKITF